MRERPLKIQQAIKSGDTEFLRQAGRRGAEVSTERRRIEEAKSLLAAEIRELEEWQRKISTNEHIIDPDGNDLEYIEDES